MLFSTRGVCDSTHCASLPAGPAFLGSLASVHFSNLARLGLEQTARGWRLRCLLVRLHIVQLPGLPHSGGALCRATLAMCTIRPSDHQGLGHDQLQSLLILSTTASHPLLVRSFLESSSGSQRRRISWNHMHMRRILMTSPVALQLVQWVAKFIPFFGGIGGNPMRTARYQPARETCLYRHEKIVIRCMTQTHLFLQEHSIARGLPPHCARRRHCLTRLHRRAPSALRVRVQLPLQQQPVGPTSHALLHVDQHQPWARRQASL